MKKERNTADTGQSSMPQEKSGITRRELLQGFGGAAIVAGVPLLSAAGQSSSRTQAANPFRSNLPPGLYEPSVEHLIHELANDSLYHAIPPGSETDYARPVKGEFKPIFFTEREFQTVRELVGILLGLPQAESTSSGAGGPESAVETTSRFIDLDISEAQSVREAWRSVSPQAHVLAIHYYGRTKVMRNENTDPPKLFREGLARLDQTSEAKYGMAFHHLAAAQQIGILKTISDERSDEGAGSRFFRLLKDETIRGYYTSRPGLKELNDPHNTFHRTSPGCPSAQPTTKSKSSVRTK